MSQYAGFVDPSLYAVIINAKQCGWVPRPPSIPLTTSQQVISKLGETSGRITENGKLDLRFAASLHERKHFLDMHLSCSLWRSFLSWFHCTSQVFTIVSLLKGKRISLPLYSHLGTLRDNPFSKREQDIINGICRGIFSNQQHQWFKHALEMSASLLQYSVLRDQYQPGRSTDPTSKQYYETFFEKPLGKFSGDLPRAFCCYTFICWFCSDYKEFETVEIQFLASTDHKKLVQTLLKDKYFARKQAEIGGDTSYLEWFAKNFNRPDTELFPDLAKYLSELVRFKKEVFSTVDHVVHMLSDMSHFISWMSTDAVKTHYLVDFGEPLPLDTEITENYQASKWIVENRQFLFLDDQLGRQILDMNELDNWINLQLLSSFLISPVRLFHFSTKIANSDFLECELIGRI